MMGDSPAVLLYDANNIALSVRNGVAIPANTPGLHVMGSDGTNSRYLTVDASGRLTVVGAGSAGTPATGVQTVQGITNGTPLNVAQITATTATLSNVTSAATSTSILSSNTSRRGFFIVNDANRPMYLKLGTTASVTSYTVMLVPAAFWEMPLPTYTGAITAIWDSSPTGSARVTELS